MIEHDILSSGSQGNAVVVNKEILIDCGVPIKSLNKYVKSLRLVLLTHVHSDHFNPATIKYLSRERPSLRFVGGYWLYKRLHKCGVSSWALDFLDYGETAVFNSGSHLAKPGYEITMIPAKHDVLNCGYAVVLPSGEKLFYMTDTSTMDGIVAKNYDLYMLEANYAESTMSERIAADMAAGQYQRHWRVVHTHLAEETALDWLYRNMGSNSQYILMHAHENITC